jgi:hypothetical protein
MIDWIMVPGVDWVTDILDDARYAGITQSDLLARYIIEAMREDSPKPNRTEEYRRIWIDAALRFASTPIRFDGAPPGYMEFVSAKPAFDAADMFLAELRKRDGEGK